MAKSQKRMITVIPAHNDRRLYVNRNIPNALFYINACGISYPNKNYFVTNHYEKHYTVQYIISGSGFIAFEGKKYELCAGDMFYISATQGISYGTNPDNPFTKIWLNGNGRFWEMSFRAFGFESPFGIIHADGRAVEYFHKAFDAAIEAELNRNVGMTALTEILNAMYDYRNGDMTAEKNDSFADMAVEIKRYIDIHLTSIKDTAEISRRFDISERTVYAKFKNAYGITPTDYITESRLELARELLSDIKASVTAISEKSGFSSASYFCKVYKDKYGMTPQQYRRSIEGRKRTKDI